MIDRIKQFIRPSRTQVEAEEREKMARLEQAERDLRVLQERKDHALRLLRERNQRNHWRESIEQMIQGVS